MLNAKLKTRQLGFLTDLPNIMPTKITRYIRYNFIMILISILPLTHGKCCMKWHVFMKLEISGKYQNRCLCTQTLYHGGCWLSVNKRCILDTLYFRLIFMTYSLTCKHSKNSTEISYIIELIVWSNPTPMDQEIEQTNHVRHSVLSGCSVYGYYTLQSLLLR